MSKRRKNSKTMIKELKDVYNMHVPEGITRKELISIYDDVRSKVDEGREKAVSDRSGEDVRVSTENFLDEAKDILENITEDKDVDNGYEEETPINVEALDIDPSDIKSSDLILSLLDDSEKDDKGHPYAHGLRRIAAFIIGPVHSQDIKVIPIHINGRDGIAAIFSISFLCRNENFGVIDSIIEYSDAADAIQGFNLQGIYNNYPTAISTTRAEGRVYRKALRLRNIITADEIEGQGETPLMKDKENGDLQISDSQSIVIDKLSKRKNIDIVKYMKENFGGNMVTPQDLNRDEAVSLIKKLNSLKEVK